jgi:hypothetical protein
MKKNSTSNTSSVQRRFLATFGLLGAIVAPATGGAVPTLDTSEPSPFAAADDPDCEQSQVHLEIDVTTGNVYLVNPNTGNLTLTDNDINVYFGSLGHVVILLHYNTGNWNVTVTPDSDPPVTYRTTNGWFRFTITDNFQQYTVSSSEQSSASTMASMTPVVPDIVIRPKPTCPPSP